VLSKLVVSNTLSSKNWFSRASDVSFLVELLVNLTFCHWYAPHQQLVTLLEWTDHFLTRPELTASLVTVLGRAAWTAWGILLASFGLLVYMQLADGVDTAWFDIPCLFGAAIAWTLAFYLCFFWIWTNWVIHTTTQYWVEHEVDAQCVGTDKKLWELLTKMKEVSNMWALNHAVRLIATTAYGTTNLLSYMRDRDTEFHTKEGKTGREVWDLISAMLSYMMVWVTAAAPGFVTDRLFSSLQRRLYKMGQDPHLEAASVSLMHRAHYLEGREGMHFAHVPMSLSRAITVGTALTYIISFVHVFVTARRVG
jgi:hypothetical protein